MKILKTLSGTALICFTMLCLGSANAANVVNGSLWNVPEAVAQNAIPGNVPARTGDITFSVNSPLNFLEGGVVSRQTFLNDGGAFNIVQNTAGALAAPMDNGTTGTLIQFLGNVSVTTGQSFSVAHDDGLTLIIDGVTVINVPGPTAPVTTTATYSGPAGNQPFQLVYGECCGGSAALQVNLPLTSPPAGGRRARAGHDGFTGNRVARIWWGSAQTQAIRSTVDAMYRDRASLVSGLFIS